MNNVRVRVDQRDVTSNLGFLQDSREEIDILPLETAVDIPLQQAKVSKKAIHVYRNENR